jgi:protein TonB
MNLLTVANLVSWSAQVAALVAAALLALKLTRLDAPAVRYVFLRVVLAVCLLLPFVQSYVAAPATSKTTPIDASRVTGAPAGRRAIPDAQLVVGTTALFGPGQQWPGALAVLLVAGGCTRLLWIGAGVIRLRRLRRAGEAACVDRECDDLQRIIKVSPTIRYVAALGQPVTFGFRRPVVLLPESMKEQPAPIQRAVLAHELWHVRRRDWIWTVAEEALRAVFWFHPAVWILLSRIQSTREEVVDELAILSTGSRRTYLDALLAYADRPPLFAAMAFARRRHLMHRMILISKEAVMSAKRVVACGALSVVAVLSAGWYSIAAFPLTQAAQTSSPSLQPGPMEQKAKPITPENPIPRRTYHVPADYPTEAEAIGMQGTVTVRLTLDESGRIVEARVAGFSIHRPGKGGMSGTFYTTRDLPKVSAETRGQGGISDGVSSEQTRAAVERVFDAALRAVRQWQYAPPYDGPMAFSVSVPVGIPDAAAMPPPPPPPPPPPGDTTGVASDGALRVGGTIKPPMKVHHVSPAYPFDAQQARVQGVVIIEARIERDGSVSATKVLKSIPMLDDAAVDAVRQWRFEPTLLNGQPVPVLMTTTVNFALD